MSRTDRNPRTPGRHSAAHRRAQVRAIRRQERAETRAQMFGTGRQF